MTATFASAAFPRTDAVALTAPFKRMPTRVIPSGTISRMNVPLALMPAPAQVVGRRALGRHAGGD